MGKLKVYFTPPNAHVSIASGREFDDPAVFAQAADGTAVVRTAGTTVWYAPGVWKWAERANPAPAAETPTRDGGAR